MGPAPEELAEDTAVYLLARPEYAMVERPGLVLEVAAHRATVQRIRLGDVEEAVAWTRAECRRRGVPQAQWCVGWSATPAGLGERLLALGLVRDETPVLTGMTCSLEPPAGPPNVEVRPIATVAEQLAALEVDWEVWNVPAEEREQAAERERGRFAAGGTVHHFAAFLDGRRVGFGRAIDMESGVALMGGAVLPDARGRGVYRALVRARWDHAVARGTPLLVVQAGAMSAPVLEGLGFRAHGTVRLFADRL